MGVSIDIALMFFTALAPAGAVAYALLAGYLVFLPDRSKATFRLERHLVIPIAICMVGLIVSALHLGTPSNALYVLKGVGRSPLSNEVASAVVFLGLSWISWLLLFLPNRPRGLFKRVLLVLAVVAAFFFVTRVGLAYDVWTVPTWSTAFVPAAQWALALSLGPSIVHIVFAWADFEARTAFLWVLVGIGFAAVVAGVLIMFAQNGGLASIENSLYSAAELVSYYGIAIVVFGICGFAGNSLNAWVVVAAGHMPRKSRLTVAVVSFCVIFAGCAAVRESFYAMRMTLGF